MQYELESPAYVNNDPINIDNSGRDVPQGLLDQNELSQKPTKFQPLGHFEGRKRFAIPWQPVVINSSFGLLAVRVAVVSFVSIKIYRKQ